MSCADILALGRVYTKAFTASHSYTRQIIAAYPNENDINILFGYAIEIQKFFLTVSNYFTFIEILYSEMIGIRSGLKMQEVTGWADS